jgi:chemotaxis family two-component system sensor kinase Cph1
VEAQKARERLIADLEAKNAELERFTYTVSHDLKAPLVTIRGFLGYVEKDIRAGNTARVRSDFERISVAIDRMAALLHDLLELSRLGRVVHPPEPVPFRQIVDRAVEVLRGRLERRGARIEMVADLPTVHGDCVRLVEIVQNLIENSVKFARDGAEPRIEVGHRGRDGDGKAVLYVRDNGIGIAPRHRERVFGLFEKLDPASEGTGVGLALVKRIVELHGGRVWVESEEGAHGSTVCFTLPCPLTAPAA